MKKANLLQLSSQLMKDKEMQNVLGGRAGVACQGTESGCRDGFNAAMNSMYEVMRTNNPPVTKPTYQ